MGFGGPVWHASAAPRPGWSLPEATLRDFALRAIEQVGDPTAGEWEEYTGRAYHIRRRLSAKEQESVGPVVDVRGTPEAERRYRRVARFLPVGCPIE